MNGLECLEEIRRRQYPVKVLVLTMYSEDQYITEVMERGADGYLCKDTLDAELFKALRTVAKGQKYLGERGAQALLNQVAQGGQKRATLSTREKEVLRALVHGYSLSDTALQLHLSIKTVSTYKTRLMQNWNANQSGISGLCLETSFDVNRMPATAIHARGCLKAFPQGRLYSIL